MLIINPGSENKGGTLEQAKINAERWLKNINLDGILDVEMKFIEQEKDKDFLFHFIHSVTKKVATLHIHGFTDEELEKFIFYPKIYWNGSSCSEPKIQDWLEKGFKFKIEYYPE